MTTPLLLVLLLTGPWCLAALLARIRGKSIVPVAAGRFGLVLAFLFTASGHFLMTEAMALMLPAWVPGRVPLVLATGVLEIAIALGFIWPRTQRWAAWTALLVLVAFFPANVYAAWREVPVGGHAWGLVYLWLRTPLQLLLLAWTWHFGLGRAFTLPVMQRGRDHDRSGRA